MGTSRILTRPAAALVALAFPLVAAGAFALGAGVDLSPTSEPDAAADTGTDVPAAPSGDPLSASRSSLQSASLPISFLAGGVTQLTDGGKQLNDGVIQLADGITQAHDGSIQLADGFGQYRDGITQLGDGANQISGGVDQVVDQLTGFGAQQTQFTASLAAAADQVARFPTPGSQEAAAQIRGVIDTIDTQGLGPATLDQLAELKSGARELAFQLGDESSDFLTATSQLSDGTVQLRDGMAQLDDGGSQLRAGTDQLVTAVGPVSGIVSGIATDVQDATQGLPTAKELTALGSSGTTAGDSPTASSATGSSATSQPDIAPYLIAALVAVGAVGAVSLVRVLSRDSRFRPVAAAVAILAVGVGASVAFTFTSPDGAPWHLVAAGAFLVVSAAAYLAAAGAIQRLLGAAVGQAVNVALLLVQLVVCGAAYASDAAIWSQLSSFSPMAYTAAGAREIGAGTVTSTGWLAIAATALLLVVSGLVYRLSSVKTEPLPDYA